MSSSGTEITSKLVRNIFGSTLYKGLDVIFNFLLVRFAISYFGEEDYGIWLTILSFFTWFSVIEFGISSSYRNRLTQYFTDQKFDKIRAWISAGYKATALIYGSVMLLFILLTFAISDAYLPFEAGFKWVFLLCFSLYMGYYIFFFLQTILLATHHTRYIYLISALQKAIILGGVLVFMAVDIKPSLTFLCIWFSAIPLISWAVAHTIAFQGLLKRFKPSFLQLTKKKIRPLRYLDRSFFIIQICTLSIYATDNLIIIYGMSGGDVTNYNIAFKYFNILIIIFNIVLVPYWSSFTEAAHRKDYQWLTKNVKRLMLLWCGMFALAIIMLFAASFAYELWIGRPVDVPFGLSFFMGISVLLTMWTTIFSYFLNSISKTQLQMYLLLGLAIINIPLSFYLMKELGLTGVIIATCVVLLPLAILLPFQYRSVISSFKAK